MFSKIIENEKRYCIDLGIDEATVNKEFQTTFSSVSEIALLRESLIDRYAAELQELKFRKNKTKVLKENEIPKKKSPFSLLDRMIRNKKATLRDFGISMETINEEFMKHDIQTARQLDIVGDELLYKHFLFMDIKDKIKSLG